MEKIEKAVFLKRYYEINLKKYPNMRTLCEKENINSRLARNLVKRGIILLKINDKIVNKE